MLYYCFCYCYHENESFSLFQLGKLLFIFDIVFFTITANSIFLIILVIQEKRIEVEKALHPTPARLTLTDPKEFHLHTSDRGLAHRAQREQVRPLILSSIVSYSTVQNEIKSNQIKSNQIKSNQIKSNFS